MNRKKDASKNTNDKVKAEGCKRVVGSNSEMDSNPKNPDEDKTDNIGSPIK